MLGQGIAGEVENVTLQMPDAAVRLHTLMHEVPDPLGPPPVVEPDLAVGVPAGMIDPASEVPGQSRHRIGIELGAGLLYVPDFGLQRFAEGLIGVEGEN